MSLKVPTYDLKQRAVFARMSHNANLIQRDKFVLLFMEVRIHIAVTN